MFRYSLMVKREFMVGISALADNKALDLDTDSVKSFGNTGFSDSALEVWITSILNGIATYFYWQLEKRCFTKPLNVTGLLFLEW